MSTSQAHFAGDYADQHQINVSTLSGNVSVYTAQPMRNSSRGQYWVGYGRLPYSVQDESVNLSIYTIPESAGMLEPHVVGYTHAYFPVGLFDEVNTDYLSSGYIFGRTGDTYIMLCALSDGEATLAFKNDTDAAGADSDRTKIKDNVREMIEASGDHRYDLILSGGKNHAWVTELSSVEEDGDFAAFIARCLENEISFADMKISYESRGKEFEAKYGEYFKLSGEYVDTDYARYENPYVKAPIQRGCEVISLEFGGKSLTLNYKEATRIY